MLYLITLPFLIQSIVILIDEVFFHLKRGLPKWERVGHPLDTLTILICLGYVLCIPYSPFHLKIYCTLSVFSCIFVTKDEFIHKECCPSTEQWLHSFLFLNHPLLLTATGLIWPTLHGQAPNWLCNWLDNAYFLKLFLWIQTGFAALFFLYQTIYWNFIWKEKKISPL
ncbi:MAG: hypothetical protein K2P51_01290 [Rhabdochlamydiaceae bacterium]|nr:hypothetical protein [Rhabdochlamydiaceae bacterium]